MQRLSTTSFRRIVRKMAYWRIRMNYSPTREDVSRQAWERGLVGIWYGAWACKDLDAVGDLGAQAAAEALSRLPSQEKLGWKIEPGFVQTARRFQAIDREDWVFTYFDQALHLGRLVSKILIDPAAEFERGGELFKVRKVGSQKSFRLDDLPESFRLLTCSGRSNIHNVPSTELFVSMLADCQNAHVVSERFRSLDWREWLDALGPKGWETLCLGYLIQEAGYLPTGLGVGLTLPDFDIVGRDRNGTVILAQCKKNPKTYRLDVQALAAYSHSSEANMFLFAYGGVEGAPPWVNVLTANDLQRWFTDSPNGKRYRELLTGSI